MLTYARGLPAVFGRIWTKISLCCTRKLSRFVQQLHFPFCKESRCASVAPVLYICCFPEAPAACCTRSARMPRLQVQPPTLPRRSDGCPLLHQGCDGNLQRAMRPWGGRSELSSNGDRAVEEEAWCCQSQLRNAGASKDGALCVQGAIAFHCTTCE